MRPMASLQDLIEEAKARTVLWAICVFVISYFLSHTSKSMWTNIPISILILAAVRYLSYEVELRRKERPIQKQSYLSHLEKKQLSVNDSRISVVPPSKWRRTIDSPPVEAAISEFVDKVLEDFVLDLWYSSITPDKEAPELIRVIILDVLGEISGRVKEINLVGLLTRDVVDLVGNHLDLYRKYQSEIGVDVMGTLSFEEKDETLKRHLIASKELHPALVSPECEHRVLQRIVGGILALVLRPQEAKCPLVRCISRELLTCLVLQPILDLASPAYINELIESVFLVNDNGTTGNVGSSTKSGAGSSVQDHSDDSEARKVVASNQLSNLSAAKCSGKISEDDHQNIDQKYYAEQGHPRPADWAVVLEASTKRRSQVLAPENLENMWTKGENYKKKNSGTLKASSLSLTEKTSGIRAVREQYAERGHLADGLEENSRISAEGSDCQLKCSSSTPDVNMALMSKPSGNLVLKEPSAELTSHSEGSLPAPKLRCKVVGACFEKLGSTSFAVYSIAVTDAENKTWFVKRRYRNFERLHRHLKDISNYLLHLPPKRFLSSSIDDYFVHQRCILLDKYLQDLLLIANVAEQHEVWDFFSVSSKKYSFERSTSVIKTLAVNVDDAMDDIVRQVKGASVGPRRSVAESSLTNVISPRIGEVGMNLNWQDEEANKHSLNYSNSYMGTSHSLSDEDAQDEDPSLGAVTGCHSDNEFNSKCFSPGIVKQMDGSSSLNSRRNQEPYQIDKIGLDKVLTSKSSAPSDFVQDLVGMPPEWAPPNVSVPLLNLVDKVFQLNRRGWLRRQVFWISKQILQLMMEDAIDDWILRHIHYIRNGEVIARGIRWIHNVLWPNGTFFIKLRSTQAQNSNQTSPDEFGRPTSFEIQLEAARRASDVKKMILGGAPTTLVSLIGNSQYQRSAKDIYYFLQSSICIKQLAYSGLELLIVSIFPELRDLILDIHEKERTASSVNEK